jgi:hypothetical protein
MAGMARERRIEGQTLSRKRQPTQETTTMRVPSSNSSVVTRAGLLAGLVALCSLAPHVAAAADAGSTKATPGAAAGQDAKATTSPTSKGKSASSKKSPDAKAQAHDAGAGPAVETSDNYRKSTIPPRPRIDLDPNATQRMATPGQDPAAPAKDKAGTAVDGKR